MEKLPTEPLLAFCQRWQIARLYVFGSILREDFGEDSDIDFLYELLPDAFWSFHHLLEAEAELAAIAKRPVDLVSKKSIETDRNWLRKKNILDTAKLVYDAA